MLAVGDAADTCEMVTVDNALETFTFRSTDDIHVLDILSEDVRDGKGVAQVELSCKVSLELGKLALGSGAGFVEVPFESCAGVFLAHFVIGKLYGGIAVFFNRTYLRDNTRTSLDNGAWNIFSISTEHGNHSDFLSN